MGGDNAPGEVVAGTLMALGGLGVEVTLVGRAEAIRAELEGTGEMPGLRIVDARDVIDMEDHPTEAVKGKPDSSINVGLRLLKYGEADAFVTAGNTGAAMAAALLTLGPHPRHRPPRARNRLPHGRGPRDHAPRYRRQR